VGAGCLSDASVRGESKCGQRDSRYLPDVAQRLAHVHGRAHAARDRALLRSHAFVLQREQLGARRAALAHVGEAADAVVGAAVHGDSHGVHHGRRQRFQAGVLAGVVHGNAHVLDPGLLPGAGHEDDGSGNGGERGARDVALRAREVAAVREVQREAVVERERGGERAAAARERGHHARGVRAGHGVEGDDADIAAVAEGELLCKGLCQVASVAHAPSHARRERDSTHHDRGTRRVLGRHAHVRVVRRQHDVDVGRAVVGHHDRLGEAGRVRGDREAHAHAHCGEHDWAAGDVAERAARDVARAGGVHVGESAFRDDPHLVDGVQRAVGRVVERDVPVLRGEDAEAGAGLLATSS